MWGAKAALTSALYNSTMLTCTSLEHYRMCYMFYVLRFLSCMYTCMCIHTCALHVLFSVMCAQMPARMCAFVGIAHISKRRRGTATRRRKTPKFHTPHMHGRRTRRTRRIYTLHIRASVHAHVYVHGCKCSSLFVLLVLSGNASRPTRGALT